MGGIKNLTQEQYNIFIYQYDYQEPFEKLVKGLIEQWQFTCNKHGIENKNIVVLAFSYGTVIFRAAPPIGSPQRPQPHAPSIEKTYASLQRPLAAE